MPAADSAMQRKVDADGALEHVEREGRNGAGVLLAAGRLGGADDAGAVDQDTLLAVGGARLGEAGLDVRVGGHVDLAEDAADLGRHRLAALGVHVEQGDLDALGGERAGRALAQARGAARDHGGD
jgi:hypothetical protein